MLNKYNSLYKCFYCSQKMIKIFINQIDKKLYCMCCECYRLWKSIDDIKNRNHIDISEIPYYGDDIPCNRSCFVYPGCDTAYCGFENMYDSNGFYIIKTAQNLSEAKKNIFIESIRYPESLTAEEYTAEVERWLKKSAGITL